MVNLVEILTLFSILGEVVKSQLIITSPPEVMVKYPDEQINVDCVNCEKLVRVISKKEGNLYFNDECDLNPKYDASKPAYAIIEANNTRKNSNQSSICLSDYSEHITFLQHRGFQMVIFLYEDDKDRWEIFLGGYVDNEEIQIPILLGEKKEFKKVREYMEKKNETVSVRVDKNLLFSEKLEVEIYMPEPSEAKQIFEALLPFENEIKEKVIKITPHFISLKGNEVFTDCSCGKQYCLSYTDKTDQVFSNNLFNYCVWKYANSQEQGPNGPVDPSIYLEFTEYFLWNFQNQTAQELLTNYFNADLGEINKCIRQSFDPEMENFSTCTSTTKNTVLEKDSISDYFDYFILMSKVTVNGKTLRRFPFTTAYLSELFCAKLGQQHIPACKGRSPNAEDEEGHFPWLVIVTIVFAILLLNLVIYYICRRYSARRLHEKFEDKEISLKINQVVSNYTQFK